VLNTCWLRNKESDCTDDLLSVNLPYLRLIALSWMHEPSLGVLLWLGVMIWLTWWQAVYSRKPTVSLASCASFPFVRFWRMRGRLGIDLRINIEIRFDAEMVVIDGIYYGLINLSSYGIVIMRGAVGRYRPISLLGHGDMTLPYLPPTPPPPQSQQREASNYCPYRWYYNKLHFSPWMVNSITTPP
jgi:hypothetical protein